MSDQNRHGMHTPDGTLSPPGSEQSSHPGSVWGVDPADSTPIAVTPASTTDDRPAGEPGPDFGTPSAPRKHRRWFRRAAIGGVAAALIVAPPTAWALNRFVIDHVEIADVAAYEAAQSATDTSGSTDTAEDATTTDTSADGSSSTSSSTTSDTPVTTDDSYTDSDTEITIKKVVTGSGDDQVTYFVADVVLSNATQLRSAFAQNEFGNNIVEYTSDIAADNDAIFAINGDYYGFRDTGIVIRNGVIYRDTGAREGLAIYRDGTMRVYDETSTTAEQLVADGVWNTLSFGPSLLTNGQVASGIDDVEVDTNVGNHSIQGSQPRTGIGIISDNHFVFVVVDGRSTGYSRGVTMSEFAQIFSDLGATTAYNLDGGGSSTMYFNGSLVNNPLGRGEERGTSDILYVG